MNHARHRFRPIPAVFREEAPSLGKPVVMRGTAERPEAVFTAVAVRLIGTDSRHIVAEVMRLLHGNEDIKP